MTKKLGLLKNAKMDKKQLQNGSNFRFENFRIFKF